MKGYWGGSGSCSVGCRGRHRGGGGEMGWRRGGDRRWAMGRGDVVGGMGGARKTGGIKVRREGEMEELVRGRSEKEGCMGGRAGGAQGKEESSY